jgi:hypothetical protein
MALILTHKTNGHIDRRTTWSARGCLGLPRPDRNPSTTGNGAYSFGKWNNASNLSALA